MALPRHVLSFPWAPGGEVWALFFNLDADAYGIRLVGKVTRVGKTGIEFRRAKTGQPERIGGMAVGYFPTREGGERHIEEHPFEAPTINERVSR